MIKLPERMSLAESQGMICYTESQMRQAIKDAYEDAAKVCDEMEEREMGAWAVECAEAIRKLKEQVE